MNDDAMRDLRMEDPVTDEQCRICGRPVTLSQDIHVDNDGNVSHLHCPVTEIVDVSVFNVKEGQVVRTEPGTD